MLLIVIYSGLLILGIAFSQFLDLTKVHHLLELLTHICLGYIMVEVGLEFTLDKTRLKNYGLDFLFAFLAAALPWILCALYFIYALHIPWKDSFLVGVFAAPTSAGILFAMLAAAGLGTSWLFRKAQILAIFDDVAAILLLIPLQVLFIGLQLKLFVVVFVLIFLLFLAFRWLHAFRWPSGKYWLIFYSIAITVIREIIYRSTDIDIGILLPAFALGAVLYNPHLNKTSDTVYDEPHQEFRNGELIPIDRLIKGLFMFLVGCSLPKMQLQGLSINAFLGHVLLLTLLSNLGKCFLFFCYRKEVPWNIRLALSIVMFPRGEVGAGVLLMAIGYGITGLELSLSVLSLALNLVLTGLFVVAAIWLAQLSALVKQLRSP